MKHNTPILLVEDDKVDVMAVQRAFKGNRIANPLHVVGDGQQALAWLRNEEPFQDPQRHPRPGLILMDLKMPRMGGLETLQQIKGNEQTCDIPVVILTSSDEEIDIKNSYRTGAATYMVKPVTFDKLVEAIRAFNLYWSLSEVP